VVNVCSKNSLKKPFRIHRITEIRNSLTKMNDTSAETP